MRIIAGRLKRRTISVPKGGEVRPTSDRIREAIFSMIGSRMDLDEADVLDLFAGTGALGLEAISRGARSVVFVERDRNAARVLLQNARTLQVEEYADFVSGDALGYLRRYGRLKFDCIFADPPYSWEYVQKLPELVIPMLAPGGLFVLEHDRRIDFDEESGMLITRAYGRTKVTLFGSGAEESQST